jgi:hypothetical protein
MSLDAIRLENSRGFRSASIELKPLTVLLGENSSGKSSFGRAMAAMAHAHHYQASSTQATCFWQVVLDSSSHLVKAFQVFRIPMRNGVTEDLPDILHCPLGQISCAAAFDHFDHGDQFRSFNLSDGARSKQRQDVCIHSPARRIHVLRALLSAPVLKPEPRDCSEGILSGGLFCCLRSLPLGHWIKAVRKQFASLGVALSGYGEGHIRILAEGHEFLQAIVTVFIVP